MYLTHTFRMQTTIGPQMVMAGQLLRASTEEVEQILLRELAENPALELAHGLPAIQQSSGWRPPAGSDDAATGAMEDQAARQTAVEQLEAQAALLVGTGDREVMLALLHLLDAHGYLRETPEKIAALFGFEPERVDRLIHTLHQMEPPGIGARNLRECLLIQCAHLQEEGVECDLPRRILEEAWDNLAGQRWDRVARKVGVSMLEIDSARMFIVNNLYPYPLRMLRNSIEPDDSLVFADLEIIRQPGGGGPLYRLEIPGEEAFRLRLSHTFEMSLSTRLSLVQEEREWVSAQVERARVFIASLEQRWNTLRRIGDCLISYQMDFLERGPRWLRPITRAAVAERLGMHESTVSRAVSDKIVSLPDSRLIPMSDLFDASLPIKEALRQVLAEAGTPLSDREIAERLKTEGLEVARRTIGKYRDQLRIPNRNLRQAV